MSFDILVTNGTLPDGRTADIGIAGGRITAIEPRLEGEAGRTVDASDCLVARLSSTRTSIWMPRSPTASRASTRPERFWRASRSGAS